MIQWKIEKPRAVNALGFFYYTGFKAMHKMNGSCTSVYGYQPGRAIALDDEDRCGYS